MSAFTFNQAVFAIVRLNETAAPMIHACVVRGQNPVAIEVESVETKQRVWIDNLFYVNSDKTTLSDVLTHELDQWVHELADRTVALIAKHPATVKKVLGVRLLPSTLTDDHLNVINSAIAEILFTIRPHKALLVPEYLREHHPVAAVESFFSLLAVKEEKKIETKAETKKVEKVKEEKKGTIPVTVSTKVTAKAPIPDTQAVKARVAATTPPKPLAMDSKAQKRLGK